MIEVGDTPIITSSIYEQQTENEGSVYNTCIRYITTGSYQVRKKTFRDMKENYSFIYDKNIDKKTGSIISPSINDIKFENPFICPLTKHVMSDPVICSDSYSYERAAIKEWLRSNDTSPVTGKKLTDKNIIDNENLRLAISFHNQN